MAMSLVLATILVILSCWLKWNVTAVAINGSWSPWPKYGSECSVSCGGGTQTRVRSCSNPYPEDGGEECTKEDGSKGMLEPKEFPCNTINCYAGTYTDWVECENCTNGISCRFALCGPNPEDICTGKEAEKQTVSCHRWDKDICPNPCEENDFICPENSVCEDHSTELEPITKCTCVMGYVMNSDKTKCVRPPPTPPTTRPIPKLPPVQKVIATVVSKTASTVLIIFVSITLITFILLRVFTPDRVIQMNMEIALLCAHICLVCPASTYEYPLMCTILSICIHFFFTACFSFMMLEALHMFSFVAYVVKEKGLCNRLQYTLIGWGLAVIVVSVCVCFEYENYGAKYHCWIQMDTALFNLQAFCFLFLTVITVALIEAAGQDNYKPLKGIDKKQRTSAKISQRGNLIILVFVIAHMMIGMLAEYEQSLALYSVFSILNGITGALVFFLHSSSNEKVRAKLSSAYKSMVGGGY